MQIDLNTILTGVAVLGIGEVIRQLWRLNGSVLRMKVWQEQHETSDKDRFDDLRSQIRELRQAGE